MKTYGRSRNTSAKSHTHESSTAPRAACTWMKDCTRQALWAAREALTDLESAIADRHYPTKIRNMPSPHFSQDLSTIQSQAPLPEGEGAAKRRVRVKQSAFLSALTPPSSILSHRLTDVPS